MEKQNHSKTATPLRASGAAAPAGMLQRKCSCGNHTFAGGQCEACQKKKRAMQRFPSATRNGTHGESEAPPIVEEVLRSSGQPLDPATRNVFDERFGRDFSRVRVHTGAQAAESARTVNASAYTVGQDVVFGSGQYAPHTGVGRRLLAHELAHTIQQEAIGPSFARKIEVGEVDDPYERQANSVAEKFDRGETAQGLERLQSLRIQRAPPAPPTATGDPRHDRGFAGEQGMGFELYSQSEGWIFFEGPSGAAGHGITNPGFDGVAYNTKIDQLHLLDNKSLKKAGNVSSATAIDPSRNLLKNLDALIERVEAAKDIPGTIPSTRKRVIELLKQSRAAAAAKVPLPDNVKLVVTGVGGRSTGVTKRLTDLGVEFRPSPSGINPAPKEPTLPSIHDELPKSIPGPKGKGLELGPLAEAEGLAKGGARSAGKLGRAGRVGGLALEGALNIGLALALLAATIIDELVIQPKLRAWKEKLDEARRTRIQDQIQKMFDAWVSPKIGRILRSCHLKRLRELEQAGKKVFVKVDLMVSFQDTSGRVQILHETPPEDVFDVEVDNIRLARVTLTDTPVVASAGALNRCESCGTFGRNKTFVSNNPLWEQEVSFSFGYPSADAIVKEFGKEDDTSCLGASCFIATACYGSLLAPEVETLRRFRDSRLLTNPPGRLFVRVYYFASPPIAGWLERHEFARSSVRRGFVAPLVRLVHKMGWDLAR